MNKSNMLCKITFGWILRSARQQSGLSQRELSVAIFQLGIPIDWMQLSKIESNRLNIRSPEFDNFVDCICELFELDRHWVETVRQQTEVSVLDLSSAAFPVYCREIK